VRSPLVDPFCGGGTLLVEAALMARNVAPGTLREKFGFQRWPGYDASAWKKLQDDARRAVKPVKLHLFGRDWDPATIAGARENMEAAGLADEIELEVGEATEWEPRKGWNAWIVTNPPYGERVGTERGLEESYRRFGEFVRTRCGGYHLALFTANPKLADALLLETANRRALLNGPLECALITARIP
jgi:putative N6-adenine-specific DNA methylase